MKVSFYTFGCTVNSYETQKMRLMFMGSGDEIVEDGQADALVINSCAITGAAEKGVMQLVARLKKKNPYGIVAVVGCYGEILKKGGKTSLKDVDIVLDNKKFDIVEAVHNLYHAKTKAAHKARLEEKTPAGRFQPARAYIQLQNGCDNWCTYCIVPVVRGGSVSRPFSEVMAEMREMAGKGYEDIVFAGLNLGYYDSEGHTLIDVLKATNEIEGIKSVRLSSLEPMNLGDRFVDELPDVKKLVPQLHISLQSGCEKTLKRMNRNYSFADFLTMITKIRRNIPGIAITTDIIVGFPGETEHDFQESIQNIIRCEFSDIHIFKYSQRKGTAAANMDDQVTEHKKEKRAILLKGVKMQARYAFYSKLVGQDVQVLFLKRAAGNSTAENLWEGVIGQNFKIFVFSEKTPPATARVRITGMHSDQEAFDGVLAE